MYQTSTIIEYNLHVHFVSSTQGPFMFSVPQRSEYGVSCSYGKNTCVSVMNEVRGSYKYACSCTSHYFSIYGSRAAKTAILAPDWTTLDFLIATRKALLLLCSFWATFKFRPALSHCKLLQSGDFISNRMKMTSKALCKFFFNYISFFRKRQLVKLDQFMTRRPVVSVHLSVTMVKWHFRFKLGRARSRM